MVSPCPEYFFPFHIVHNAHILLANMTDQPVATKPESCESESGGPESSEPVIDLDVLLREKEQRQAKLLAMNPDTKMVSHSRVNHMTVRL